MVAAVLLHVRPSDDRFLSIFFGFCTWWSNFLGSIKFSMLGGNMYYCNYGGSVQMAGLSVIKGVACFAAFAVCSSTIGFTSIFLEVGGGMMPAHNNFMIAKFTAQMRPRARGSQRVTKEHNSFIGASITHSELKVETSEIKKS